MKRGVILQNRKLKIPSEVVYILAVALLSLAVAMLTAANFGVSMIVAPAYLLSLKVGIFTFGQAEYVIQAGLFIIFCIVMRGFRAVYLSARRSISGGASRSLILMSPRPGACPCR